MSSIPLPVALPRLADLDPLLCQRHEVLPGFGFGSGMAWVYSFDENSGRSVACLWGPGWHNLDGRAGNLMVRIPVTAPTGAALAEALRDRIGRHAAHALWDLLCRQQHDAARARRTVADLLRHPAGRQACRDLAAAGKAYGAKAEDFARRPVVKQAVALLRERLARRTAAQRLTPESGRIARLATARKLARVRAAVLAAADYRRCGHGHSDIVFFGAAGARSVVTGHKGYIRQPSTLVSYHTYTVPEDWLDAVEEEGLARCDGLLTLDARPVPGHDDVDLFRAVWVEQGRGTALNTERGFLARLGTTTYHAATARGAIEGVRRKAGVTPPRRALDLDRLVKRYGSVLVTHDHRRGIACDSGTRNWCAAVGLDFLAEAVTLADVVRCYRLRPLPEVLAVVRRAVKDHRAWERVLSTPVPNVRFDSEGGFHAEE